MVQPFLSGSLFASAFASVRGHVLRRRRWACLAARAGLTVALGACSLACTTCTSQTDNTTAAALSISRTNFVYGGMERWLTGISLFDALGPHPLRDEDLDALAAWGVSIVRVWAHWNAPIYDSAGLLHAEGQARLRALVERLRARGFILELVLLRPGQLPGERFAVFASADARIQAVRQISEFLRSYRNVLFDLYNEHDHPHGAISHRDLRQLRDAVKQIDPNRIVTVSSTAYHFLDPQNVLDEHGRANVMEEIGQADGSVGADLLAVHLPHNPGWVEATEVRIRTLRLALGEMKRGVPIYVSEGPRARPEEPRILADSYLAAADRARQAGAAGWVFHTSAGYRLGEVAFLDALNDDERQALAHLKRGAKQ
jgi:hypothetical protein